MLNFNDVETGLPEIYRRDTIYVVKCPEWNDEGYQVCTFNGTVFEYHSQPNDMFMDTVEAWAVLALNSFQINKLERITRYENL